MDAAGISVVQTQVGDKYVLNEMRKLNAVIGGEQSGHMIFLDHNSTGDVLSQRFSSWLRACVTISRFGDGGAHAALPAGAHQRACG